MSTAPSRTTAERRGNRFHNVPAFVLVLVLVASASGNALADQDSKRLKAAQLRWSWFPILALSPETSFMLGAGNVLHLDVGDDRPRPDRRRRARRSSITITAAYTLKHQFFAEMMPTIYVDGGQWTVGGALYGRRFPDTLYAAGPDSSDDSAENYDQRSFGAHVRVSRLVWSAFGLGLSVAATHDTITDYESSGLLAAGLLGSDGGPVIGIATSAGWDSRDRDFATRRGHQTGISATYYHRWLGSSYNFIALDVGARSFISVGSKNVLGLQARGRLSFGDVPFQSMSRLGGPNQLRGFFGSRYWDRHMAYVQGEYRRDLWWRLGMTVFVGGGNVAPSVAALSSTDIKIAGGLGLRFAMNTRDGVNLRLDFAATSAGPSYYISLGEAF